MLSPIVSRLEAAPMAELPARTVVEAIAAGAKVPEYAVDVRLVLCLHTLLSDEINAATVELALTRRDIVRGIDVAGPEQPLGARLDSVEKAFRQRFQPLFERRRVSDQRLVASLFPWLEDLNAKQIVVEVI